MSSFETFWCVDELFCITCTCFAAEGSWTCGGTAGVRQETTSSPAAAPASTPAAQQTPAFRAILPSFVSSHSFILKAQWFKNTE